MFELDGTKIRSLLLDRQMTIRDFAKTAGLAEATAQKVARGNAKTNARTTGKIATALGVDAQQILRSDSTNDWKCDV